MSKLNIAFAALANRSPSVAAQIGREFWKDEEATSFPGLNGMIREWEKRDSPGAERWIESLNEGKLKTSAKQIFLTVKALTDPERAATRLGEIDPNAGYSFASVLGESIDLARCPEMAEQLLQKRSEGSPSPGIIAPFLDSWGKRDPDAMKEWLFSQDLDAIGPDVVQQSLASLSIDDPKALIEEISPRLGVQPALRKAASEAWWGWIATDGEETSAIAWLRENSALAPEFGERRAIYRLSDSSNWSPERTSRVLAALKTLPQDDSLAAFTQDFLGKISEYQPKLVLDFAIDSLPLGSRSDQTVSRAVGKWAETEPEAAIQWSLEHLESTDVRESTLRSAIFRWGREDPLAAANMARNFPEKERNSALGNLGEGWADKDPQGILSYLKEATDPSAISSLTRHAFRQFSEDRRGADYVREALSMPGGKMRHDAVRGLFEGWALTDTSGGAAAIEQIPAGTLRDAAIQGFNGFAIRSDPKLAIELATRISVPATRDRELVWRGRSWLKQDRKAAEAAIRVNPAIPATVKAEIFKPTTP